MERIIPLEDPIRGGLHGWWAFDCCIRSHFAAKPPQAQKKNLSQYNTCMLRLLNTNQI